MTWAGLHKYAFPLHEGRGSDFFFRRLFQSVVPIAELQSQRLSLLRTISKRTQSPGCPSELQPVSCVHCESEGACFANNIKQTWSLSIQRVSVYLQLLFHLKLKLDGPGSADGLVGWLSD